MHRPVLPRNQAKSTETQANAAKIVFVDLEHVDRLDALGIVNAESRKLSNEISLASRGESDISGLLAMTT